MTFNDLNTLGKAREPFVFVIDYKAQKIHAFKIDELEDEDIEFSIQENYSFKKHEHALLTAPLTFESYKKQFAKVIERIKAGETYILNLTASTKIESHLSLKEIYSLANAHYKLRFKEKFVCFSPETFIKIEDEKIHTFPMKGTIDASVQNAQERILADQKEMAEHVMIVDLLRNDLSIVAKNVKVDKFRYITNVKAGERDLLQVSSHISGDIATSWHEEIGTILEALLPAGSISGAPKKSTLQIIDGIEEYERGYFSGVFGFYDGEKLDSAVMIRFIEKQKKDYCYKSGGGITLDSDPLMEYEELQNKIYLP